MPHAFSISTNNSTSQRSQNLKKTYVEGYSSSGLVLLNFDAGDLSHSRLYLVPYIQAINMFQ